MKASVLVTPNDTVIRYNEKPPLHVSLLSRDIAGNFVHHLTQKQIAKVAKRLEPKRSETYGKGHHHHHNKADEVISVEHLQSLFDDINVRASHAELRALAAVLSATEGDHFTTSDTTASRLLELANEPHLHVWSSEEWHVALKEERKKLSDTAREAEYQHLLQKESIKLHRLANVKKKVKRGKDRSFDVHKKAKKHLAKVASKRRKIFEQKWKRVKDNKEATRAHKKRQEKEGHVHINFERLLFRLRQGKIDVAEFEHQCEQQEDDKGGEQEEGKHNELPGSGIIDRDTFFNILKSCCVGIKFTPQEYQHVFNILDPDDTGNVSYEDFLWALKRQRGNNGFTLELPQFKSVPQSPITRRKKNSNNSNNSNIDLTRNNVDNNDGILDDYNRYYKGNNSNSGGGGSSSNSSSYSSSERSSSNSKVLIPGIVIVGIVQAAGFDVTNTVVRIGVGNTATTSRCTEVRWNSKSPTYNELWACNAKNSSPVVATVLGCNQEGVPTQSIGFCTVPVIAPTEDSGLKVEDRWYPLNCSPRQQSDPYEFSSSASTSHILGDLNTNSSEMPPEVHIVTCVVPRTVPSALVVERPGHHVLGRLQWTITSQGQLQSGIAFLFHGVLVLTKTPTEYGKDSLFVEQAFPLWGCTTNADETIQRNSATSSDDEYDAYDSDDSYDETVKKQTNNVCLSGVSIALAARTMSASDESGRVLMTTLELFPLDCSVKKLRSVIEAASEHYRPRGGWCVPRNHVSGGTTGSEGLLGPTSFPSTSFQCMLVEQNMTKWPGTLRVNRNVITFSAQSPLGYMSAEINVSTIKNVAISGQHVMPPTNAITITYVVAEEDETVRHHTFTTLPSAGLALQCIMENIREYSTLYFEPDEVSYRRSNGIMFPRQDPVPLESFHLLGNDANVVPATTPKGFSKIDNFYHDTLLTEIHHFGPKGRHAPVVRRVLGLVVVDNLETTKPTPPSSARSKRRKKMARRGRHLRAEKTGNRTLSSPSSSPFSSPSAARTNTSANNKRTEQQQRVHWMKEIKVLSLLEFTSGSGRPFTQLVEHVPSEKIFALRVIPSQTQNMFELARQAVVALRVDHPNICRCYGTTQVGHSIQFLWEHSSMTLTDHVYNAHLGNDDTTLYAPPQLSKVWIQQLVRSLSHLHSLGIVHRNVIGSNVMIMNDGTVRLNGFGISKYLATGRTTTICGEPTNMSPERVLGQPHGFGSDWWSIGLLLHELYSGQPLFSLKVNDKNLGIYERIVACRYSIASTIHSSWANIIRRLVAQETYRLGCTGMERNGSCGAEVLMYLATREWWEGSEQSGAGAGTSTSGS